MECGVLQISPFSCDVIANAKICSDPCTKRHRMSWSLGLCDSIGTTAEFSIELEWIFKLHWMDWINSDHWNNTSHKRIQMSLLYIWNTPVYIFHGQWEIRNAKYICCIRIQIICYILLRLLPISEIYRTVYI